MVASTLHEYLVSYGNAGEFGRFQAAVPLACRRGDRVLVNGRRGPELGVVLCEATPRHVRMLAEAPPGQLLRLATPEDEELDLRTRERCRTLFEDGRRLAGELGLPLEVLDVEMALDGRQGTVQYLGAPGCPVDAFAAELSRRHDLFLHLHNLAQLVPVEEPSGGCGKPDCGQAGGGGCTSCATGGCATGCGSGPVDVSPYFAHLRAQMEKRNRTPLL